MRTLGKYQLIDRLGRGGMAEVWRAKIVGPAGFQRTVVVKQILPHLAEDKHLLDMFVREARLCARLSHSNIVQVFELGDQDGEYFLAMEYVRGQDLVSVLRRHLGRTALPPPGFGAYVVREVCRALAYAHSLTDESGKPLGLIHRDVSPSNVMIAYDGSVKLLDFGIAKALNEASEHLTQTGVLKGKFGYMSPEQVEGKPIDHRTDLFACGVLLHELLTGRRLFRGQSDAHTIDLVRAAEVKPPSFFNPEVPAELDRITLRALARNLDERYPRCDDLAYELDRISHELDFGQERAALLVRSLFPAEPTTTSESVGYDTTQPQLGSKPTRLGLRRALVMAGVLALVGGGVLVARSGPQKAAVAIAPAPAPAPAPTPAPAPAPSPTVTVRVNSTPSGAEVFVGDATAPRGQTPLELTLARGRAPIKLRVSKKSYQENVVDVTPDADARLELTLTPSWAVPFSPRKKLP
jgi:serine/threonine protein kinase